MSESELMEVLSNLSKVLQDWWPTIYVVAYFLGALLIVSSIVGLGRSAREGYAQTLRVFAYTFIPGVALFNFPTVLNAFSESMFLKGSEQVLSYAPSSSAYAPFIKFAVYIIMSVGAVAVVRGFIYIRQAEGEGKNWGPALTHIIGGVLALNFLTFIEILGNTLGGGMADTIQTLFGK